MSPGRAHDENSLSNLVLASQIQFQEKVVSPKVASSKSRLVSLLPSSITDKLSENASYSKSLSEKRSALTHNLSPSSLSSEARAKHHSEQPSKTMNSLITILAEASKLNKPTVITVTESIGQSEKAIAKPAANISSGSYNSDCISSSDTPNESFSFSPTGPKLSTSSFHTAQKTSDDSKYFHNSPISAADELMVLEAKLDVLSNVLKSRASQPQPAARAPEVSETDSDFLAPLGRSSSGPSTSPVRPGFKSKSEVVDIMQPGTKQFARSSSTPMNTEAANAGEMPF